MRYGLHRFGQLHQLRIHLQVIDPKLTMSRADGFVKTFVQILSLVRLGHVCLMVLVVDSFSF